MHLIIGNKNYSSWSLRPWLLLKHFDVAFTEELIPLFREDSAQKLKSASDAAKVPVLLDKGATIWDSLAICDYINEQYLQGAGWPSDPHKRAVARSCAAEMHSSFFALRNTMHMNCRGMNRKVEIPPELEKDIRRIEAIWTEHQEADSDKPWLFGEFSIVDCMFAPVAFRFQTYGVEVNSAANQYMQALLAHPAMHEWLEAGKQETWVIAYAEVGL